MLRISSLRVPQRPNVAVNVDATDSSPFFGDQNRDTSTAPNRLYRFRSSPSVLRITRRLTERQKSGKRSTGLGDTSSEHDNISTAANTGEQGKTTAYSNNTRRFGIRFSQREQPSGTHHGREIPSQSSSSSRTTPVIQQSTEPIIIAPTQEEQDNHRNHESYVRGRRKATLSRRLIEFVHEVFSGLGRLKIRRVSVRFPPVLNRTESHIVINMENSSSAESVMEDDLEVYDIFESIDNGEEVSISELEKMVDRALSDEMRTKAQEQDTPYTRENDK